VPVRSTSITRRKGPGILYAAKPEYIDSLAGFVRSRTLPPVEAFLRQSDAVIGHDASAQLGRITAPTQVTVGRHYLLCSTRFVDVLTGGIADTELVVFEDCSHGAIHENVEASNARTPAFLHDHRE
jgi:pimeloyl-ACP methyl ester carboxylesterase